MRPTPSSCVSLREILYLVRNEQALLHLQVDLQETSQELDVVDILMFGEGELGRRVAQTRFEVGVEKAEGRVGVPHF